MFSELILFLLPCMIYISNLYFNELNVSKSIIFDFMLIYFSLASLVMTI